MENRRKTKHLCKLVSSLLSVTIAINFCHTDEECHGARKDFLQEEEQDKNASLT